MTRLYYGTAAFTPVIAVPDTVIVIVITITVVAPPAQWTLFLLLIRIITPTFES